MNDRFFDHDAVHHPHARLCEHEQAGPRVHLPRRPAVNSAAHEYFIVARGCLARILGFVRLHLLDVRLHERVHLMMELRGDAQNGLRFLLAERRIELPARGGVIGIRRYRQTTDDLC